MSTQRKKLNNKSAVIVVVSILVALIIFGIVAFTLSNCNKATCADITSFNISPHLKCTINKDECVYNAEDNSDNLFIYITVENLDEPEDSHEDLLNDDSVPLANEVTDEELDKLSWDEINRINEKTILKNRKNYNEAKSISKYSVPVAFQNNTALKESSIPRGDDDDYDSNSSILNIGILPKHTKDFKLTYKLFDDNIVTWRFNPRANDIEGFEDPVDIHFILKGRSSKEMNQYKEEKFNDVKDKQQIQDCQFHNLNIHFVDGWYLDKQFSANITIKNPSFENAKISITYSSSKSAEQYAKEGAARIGPDTHIETVSFGENTFYKHKKDELSCILYLAETDKSSFNIAVDNIELGNLNNLLANFKIN